MQQKQSGDDIAEEWLHAGRMYRNKDAFCNSNESDYSDNDDENCYENNEQQQLPENCCNKTVSPILQELINNFADFIHFHLLMKM